MTCAFLGGSIGSWLGVRAYVDFGWGGVCGLITVLAAIALARHLLHLTRRSRPAAQTEVGRADYRRRRAADWPITTGAPGSRPGSCRRRSGRGGSDGEGGAEGACRRMGRDQSSEIAQATFVRFMADQAGIMAVNRAAEALADDPASPGAFARGAYRRLCVGPYRVLYESKGPDHHRADRPGISRRSPIRAMAASTSASSTCSADAQSLRAIRTVNAHCRFSTDGHGGPRKRGPALPTLERHAYGVGKDQYRTMTFLAGAMVRLFLRCRLSSPVSAAPDLRIVQVTRASR